MFNTSRLLFRRNTACYRQQAHVAVRIPQLNTTTAMSSVDQPNEAVRLLSELFHSHHGNVLVLTGAGISTDSGIPDYRGDNGTYRRNPNHRPILYAEMTAANVAYRQRYWARGFLGWRLIAEATPNPTHYALSWLLDHGHIQGIVTQNVDDLHRRSGVSTERLVELHGTLRSVECLDCQTSILREHYQHRLHARNPRWAEYQRSLQKRDEQPRTNPDGDVDLPGVLSYKDFDIPPCTTCSSLRLKPRVVFFGENVHPDIHEKAERLVRDATALLVIGSTLTTYSAFRLARLASELGKPLGILNRGPTRADDLATWKIDLPCSPILEQVRLRLGDQP